MKSLFNLVSSSLGGRRKIRHKWSWPLKPSRKCLLGLTYKIITSSQKNVTSLSRTEETPVNSWRESIVCCAFFADSSSCSLQKKEKTFPASVHNRGSQVVWNDLEGVSSLPKSLRRIGSKVQSTEPLPYHLGKFCIQKEERSSPGEVFSMRNHYKCWKSFHHWCAWVVVSEFLVCCFPYSPHPCPTTIRFESKDLNLHVTCRI